MGICGVGYYGKVFIDTGNCVVNIANCVKNAGIVCVAGQVKVVVCRCAHVKIEQRRGKGIGLRNAHAEDACL